MHTNRHEWTSREQAKRKSTRSRKGAKTQRKGIKESGREKAQKAQKEGGKTIAAKEHKDRKEKMEQEGTK